MCGSESKTLIQTLIQRFAFSGACRRAGCYLWSPHPFSSLWRFHLCHGSGCRLTASSVLCLCSHRRPITCRLLPFLQQQRDQDSPGRYVSADTQLSLPIVCVYLCSQWGLHTSTKLGSSVSPVMWVSWKQKAVRLRGAPVLSSVFFFFFSSYFSLPLVF